MQAYPNSGCMRDSNRKKRVWSCAWLWSEDVTSVVCPTPARRRDSGHIPHSSRKTWLRSYAQLLSYVWLQSEDVTPIVCLTPIGSLTPVGGCNSSRMHDSDHMPGSGRKTRLRSYAGLRSEDVTTVVCPTLVERRDSGRKMWLRSYAWLWSHITALVIDCIACLTYSLWNTSHGRARWLQHLTAWSLSQKQTELECMTRSAFETLASHSFAC
jgi:hypothetical protein